jgi:hypothetical protein
MDRRHAAALALLVLFAGCTQYYRNVRHPEYANPEFHKDLYECSQKHIYPLSTIRESPDDSRVEVDQTLIQLCMAERGWRRAN